MPYKDISELPSNLKKFSDVVKRQWMHVFNSTHDKIMKEMNNSKKAEMRAFMAANSILKKRMKMMKSSESHSDYFGYLVEDYLGNLKG